MRIFAQQSLGTQRPFVDRLTDIDFDQFNDCMKYQLQIINYVTPSTGLTACLQFSANCLLLNETVERCSEFKVQ
jgi:hypothetical protein